MTNKTEEMKAKLESEKQENDGYVRIETEGKYIKKDKGEGQTETTSEKKYFRGEPVDEQPKKKPAKPVHVMGAGVPYLTAGIIWFLFAMIVPIYRLINIFWVSVIAWLAAYILLKIRNKQVAKLPPKPEVKVFSDDIACKLNSLKDLVIDRAEKIRNKEVRENLGSIAITLSKMADEVEHDPKDGQKVRKLANYYGDMFLGLVDKYINYENNADVVPEGVNITQGMKKIEDAIEGVDASLKKLLDNLFSMDTLETNAEINTLDNLMQLDLGKKATDIVDTNYLDDNFNETALEGVISEGLKDKEN